MNGGMGGYNGLGNMPHDEGDETGDDELMRELMEAMESGSNAESEGDVAPIPGAEAEEGQSGEHQMDPEKLKELLEMLKGAGGGHVSMDVADGGKPY